MVFEVLVANTRSDNLVLNSFFLCFSVETIISNIKEMVEFLSSLVNVNFAFLYFRKVEKTKFFNDF